MIELFSLSDISNIVFNYTDKNTINNFSQTNKLNHSLITSRYCRIKLKSNLKENSLIDFFQNSLVRQKISHLSIRSPSITSAVLKLIFDQCVDLVSLKLRKGQVEDLMQCTTIHSSLRSLFLIDFPQLKSIQSIDVITPNLTELNLSHKDKTIGCKRNTLNLQDLNVLQKLPIKKIWLQGRVVNKIQAEGVLSNLKEIPTLEQLFLPTHPVFSQIKRYQVPDNIQLIDLSHVYHSGAKLHTYIGSHKVGAQVIANINPIESGFEDLGYLKFTLCKETNQTIIPCLENNHPKLTYLKLKKFSFPTVVDPHKHFYNLTYLSINIKAGNNHALTCFLAKCPHLRTLSLTFPKIKKWLLNDCEFQANKNLTQLEIKEAGRLLDERVYEKFAHAYANLTQLSLRFCNLSVTDLSHFKKHCENIQYLNIQGSSIRTEHLPFGQIIKGFAHLKVFSFDYLKHPNEQHPLSRQYTNLTLIDSSIRSYN